MTDCERVGRYILYQTAGEYRFSADSLLLAPFASAAKGDAIADLCAGSGVAGFSALDKIGGEGRVDFYEINPVFCRLIERAAEENGISDRCGVLEGPLQGRATAAGKYDFVLCNPPYRAAARTALPGGEAERRAYYRAAAKTECALCFSELADAVRRILKAGGKFAFCYPIDRMSEAFAALETRGLAVKRVRFVCAAAGKAPYLFLAEAKKGAKPGLVAEPTVVLDDKEKTK